MAGKRKTATVKPEPEKLPAEMHEKRTTATRQLMAKVKVIQQPADLEGGQE
jgi:hypothetical protein